MSEYRHFIAYMYEYEDGKKTKNAGFVKVNMRNEICRIQLKIRSGRKELMQCQIYGFFHEGEWLYGILMGRAVMRGGSCECTVTTTENIFQEQGYSFAQISGVWIQAESEEKQPGGLFLTVWDERPVDSRKLTTEHFTEKKKDETESEAEPEADGKKEVEEQQELEAQNRQGDLPEKCSLSSRWEQFQFQYPHMMPFADDEITECIQIAPKDITFLGEKERVYAVSPFVQQKYMKYHHLMLGRHENGEYILAVPGLNRGTQDQNLAAMYGFSEYKAAEEKEFGYWYHFL